MARSATHRGRPNSQKGTRGGAGLRHGVARREFGPLLPALRSRRAPLVVLDTLRRSVQLPHMPLLTPWGTPSSLSAGRILKCFPHPIARSAARTVAGQTLKNEPAEVRGSGTGWREENSALCSQRL